MQAYVQKDSEMEWIHVGGIASLISDGIGYDQECIDDKCWYGWLKCVSGVKNWWMPSKMVEEGSKLLSGKNVLVWDELWPDLGDLLIVRELKTSVWTDMCLQCNAAVGKAWAVSKMVGKRLKMLSAKNVSLCNEFWTDLLDPVVDRERMIHS